MTNLLTHRVDGTGPTVALLNGGLMSIAAWEPIASRLGSTFRALRFDFRGQLLSPGPANASLAEHADDVIALLDHLEIDSAHLIGASFGAEVAVIVAARYPHRVRSLICLTGTDRLTESMIRESLEMRELAESAANGGDGSLVFEMLAPQTFSEKWRKANEEHLRARAKQFRLLPPTFFAGLVGLMSAFVTLDLEADMPRITAPTLIVGAEQDRVFPVEHSRRLADTIPGAHLKVIEDAGHGAILEATDEVIENVTGFLTSTEKSFASSHDNENRRSKA